MSPQEAALAITELVRERDRLQVQVAKLNDHLVGLTERLLDVPNSDVIERELAKVAKDAYRRGYHTGWNVGREGRPLNPNPEAAARGALRELLKAA